MSNTYDHYSALIFESDASTQAKRLGLKYAGYGNWKNAQGQTVARTVDGELVYMNTSLPRPGQYNVTAPKPSIEPDQTNNPALFDEAVAYFDQHLPQYSKLAKLKYFDEEKTVVLDPHTQHDEYSDLFSAHLGEDSNTSKLRQHRHYQAKENRYTDSYKHIGKAQADGWIAKLPDNVFRGMLTATNEWMNSPQFFMNKEKRDKMWNFLNALINGKMSDTGPAYFQINEPIERGLSLSTPKDTINVISNLKKGTLCPSGFSLDKTVARRFGNGGGGVGMVLRMHPTKKGIKGLNLHSWAESPETLKKIDMNVGPPQGEKPTRNREVIDGLDDFKEEVEVIVPETKYRIKGVTKYIWCSNTKSLMLANMSKHYPKEWQISYFIDIEPIYEE